MEVFEVISPIENIETIAVGISIRDVERLRKTYGSGRRRKSKGFESEAELPWYEAHGIGKQTSE